MSDDDWDTDPDFENNMTETEKRRAGNVEHLNELNSATASMSMDAVRARAHSLNARAGEIDIANVRAEKAAADKRHPDATTSTAATERPAAPAKPAPGSLAGRWEENTRNTEREAALAAQSREAEAKAKKEAEAEALKQKAEAEAQENVRQEALRRAEQERQEAADREKQEKLQAVAEAEAKTQSMMAEAQRMMAEAAQIKASAEAEAQRTIAAAEAEAQVKIDVHIAAPCSARYPTMYVLRIYLSQVTREAGERAKREGEAQAQAQRAAEEQARAEEEARLASHAQAAAQQEAEAKALEATNRAQFLETLDAANEAPLPGYEGAAQHAKSFAQSSWQGAGGTVAVATRAVNAFASAATATSPKKQAPMEVGSKVWALHVPEGEDEAEGGRWVPGRVLLHRVVRTGAGGGTQMKVSLDGYDSETDEWVDCGSERVRPYAASTDAKEAARQEAAENEASRLYAEQRKRDDRLELSLAASGFQG